MATWLGSNLSETLRCPDITHNCPNLRLPITAQNLIYNRPALPPLLLPEFLSTMQLDHNLDLIEIKIIRDTFFKYQCIPQKLIKSALFMWSFAKTLCSLPGPQVKHNRKFLTRAEIFAKNNNTGASSLPLSAGSGQSWF